MCSEISKFRILYHKSHFFGMFNWIYGGKKKYTHPEKRFVPWHCNTIWQIFATKTLVKWQRNKICLWDIKPHFLYLMYDVSYLSSCHFFFLRDGIFHKIKIKFGIYNQMVCLTTVKFLIYFQYLSSSLPQ